MSDNHEAAPIVTADQIQEWRLLFGQDPLTYDDVVWCSSNKPRGFITLQRVRALASSSNDSGLGESVPTDVFLIAKGEPPRRDVTKIGGLPYRPRGLAWPCRADGAPMTFLAQFRFCESRDIVGDLPGDILLIFTRAKKKMLYWPDDDVEKLFYFEWHRLGYDDLITPSETPPPAWKFLIGYGCRYRDVDYPSATAQAALVRQLSPLAESFPVDFLALQYGRFLGIKIGGAPYWPDPDNSEAVMGLPGRFLCSLGTIGSGIGAFPWVNHRFPESENNSMDDMLIFRDGEVINFSIDEQGQLHWVAQFY